MSKILQTNKKYWPFALVICLLLNIFAALPIYAEVAEPIKEEITETAQSQLKKSLDYIYSETTEPTFFDEWSILALARANYKVDEDYYNKYFQNVENDIKELMIKNDGKIHKHKGTEHSRLILALTSIGKDIINVGGYDISKALADFDFAKRPTVNAPIYALMAFDSNNHTIPKLGTEIEESTRDKFIAEILANEINKNEETAGGWALSGSNVEVDMTAMAIQALAPYYKTNEEVKQAVDRGVAKLSELQNSKGGYESWGTPNSNSIAQVIVALTSIGIDPNKHPDFVKDGNSVVDSLLTFATADGAFMNTKASDGSAGFVNMMATSQSTYALVAYDRFLKGKNTLYDMTDVQTPSTDKEAIGHVTVAVEKFTLGTGYVKEPVRVAFYEEDKVSNIMERFLGEGEYRYSAPSQYGVYLNSVKDYDKSEVNIPQYIVDKYKENEDKNIEAKDYDGWLSEFDYTSQSGWSYTVANENPSVGMSSYTPRDGDVIRMQYTVYGYGSDLGFSSEWQQSYITTADKDLLTAKIAEINSSSDKENILSNKAVKTAYKIAYKSLSNLESSQASNDKALEQLSTALKNQDLSSINLIKPKQSQVESNKDWTIKFNDNVKSLESFKENIFVIDENNKIQNVEIKRDEASTDSVKILAPTSGYKTGQTYTIIIKDIESEKGKILNKTTTMDFSIR